MSILSSCACAPFKLVCLGCHSHLPLAYLPVPVYPKGSIYFILFTSTQQEFAREYKVSKTSLFPSFSNVSLRTYATPLRNCHTPLFLSSSSASSSISSPHCGPSTSTGIFYCSLPSNFFCGVPLEKVRCDSLSLFIQKNATLFRNTMHIPWQKRVDKQKWQQQFVVALFPWGCCLVWRGMDPGTQTYTQTQQQQELQQTDLNNKTK